MCRLLVIAAVLTAACGRFGFDTIDPSLDAPDGPADVFSPLMLPPGGSAWRLARGVTPDSLYALFGRDRVFRTADGGLTWTECARAEADAILVDPNGVVYAGGQRLYKSVDDCATWSTLTGPPIRDLAFIGGKLFAATDVGLRVLEGGMWTTRLTPFEGARVQAIAADASGTTILIGSDDLGIARSTDGGTVWQISNSGVVNLSIADLTFAEATAGRVYAATDNSTVGNAALRSDDLGVTWSVINGLGRRFVAAAPTDAEFVLLADHNDLLLSTNGGTAFASVRSPEMALARPNEIVFGANRAWVATTRGVFETPVPAIAWQPRLGDVQAFSLTSFAATPTGKPYYFGTECGVVKTIDGVSFSLHYSGLSTRSFVADVLVLPSAPDTIFAAGRHIWMSTNAGGSFSTVFDPTGQDDYAINALAIAGTRIYAGTDARILTADPPWSTWTPTMIMGQPHEVHDILALADNHVIVSTADGVFESRDGGVSFTPITAPTGSVPTESPLVLAPGGAVWLGTPDGVWQLVPALERRGLDGRVVGALAANGASIVATTDAGVYVTHTDGATWQRVPGLELRQPTVIGVDAGDLLIGTVGYGLLRTPFPR